MNAHTLKEILVGELGGVEDGDTVNVPNDSRVTLLVRYGDDLLPVTKLRHVQFGEDYLKLVGENEQFFVDRDCDFLVKAEDVRKREDGRPGFH